MEQNFKNAVSAECSLKFENMKRESLVIANQHVAVNKYLGFVHTARHAPGGCHLPNIVLSSWNLKRTYTV